MKKFALSAILILASIAIKAQIKVYSGGKVAFGSTTSTPNYQIDVKAGDINVDSLTRGYRINGKYVLRQNNKSNCIFVGTEAGNNNTAVRNTAAGYRALYTASSATATPCTAFGYKALYTNNAYLNDAFGDSALYANTTGAGNLAVGSWALTKCTTGVNNVSLGGRSMESLTSGSTNTAVGWAALFTNNSNGSTAVGFEALRNSNSQANTAIGYQSLKGNTTGGGLNVGVGYQAGITVTTGSLNTFVGSYSNANATTYTNCASFGYNTVVTANNKIFFGNSSASGCYNFPNVWAAQSDSRFKNDIKENVKGLEFIKKLRPVTYKLDPKKYTEFVTQSLPDSVRREYIGNLDFSVASSKIHSGFLAQEVEQALHQSDFSSSTIVIPPSNASDPYSLNYVELVVPLVKAIQELSYIVDSLQQKLNSANSSGTTAGNVNGLGNESIGLSGAKLWQNTPNPFNRETVIKCFVPAKSKTASILVFDLTGALRKTVAVSGTGEISVTIHANELLAGMYHYSLIIDSQEIDTKKMILTN